MKMKNKITNRLFVRMFYTIAAVMSMFSCTDRFTEYNTDKTQMMAVGPKELAGLFSNSQYAGVNWITTDNMSRMGSTIGGHFSGFTVCGINNQEELPTNPGCRIPVSMEFLAEQYLP